MEKYPGGGRHKPLLAARARPAPQEASGRRRNALSSALPISPTHRPPLRRNRKTLQHARRRGLWARRVVFEERGFFGRASGAPPRLSVPFGRSPFSLFDQAREACGRRASRRTRGPQPRRTSPGSSPGLPSGLALEDQLLDFLSADNPPSANLRLRCDDASLWLQGAPPSSPANARTRRCTCGGPPPPTSRRVRAPSLPPPAPSPCLTSCTPHKVRWAVWRTHTHTQWVALRSWPGARRLPRPQRHACGTRFSPRDTPYAMPTHTRSLAAAHGPHPAPHTQPPERHARGPDARPIRASRCVCLLCTPPFSRQCTRPATSHGEAAPPTARHSHCTAACSSLPTACP